MIKTLESLGALYIYTHTSRLLVNNKVNKSIKKIVMKPKK